MVREQAALSVLLQFLCNIRFCLNCTAETLILSYKHFYFEGGVGQIQAWMPAFMLAYYAFPRLYTSLDSDG
jgi:hypothetical protein